MSDGYKRRVMLETLHDIVDELDYYQLLRLDPDCKQSDISTAYKQESKRLHPDQSRSLEGIDDKANYIFTAINEAFRVLKEPDSRLEYDSLIAKGQIRVEDTALNSNADSGGSKDPSNAATTEKSKKYWTLALSDYESGRFESF